MANWDWNWNYCCYSQMLITLVVVILMSSSGKYCNGSSLEEVEAMKEALRKQKGWTLFANAVATSELQYQLLRASDAAATVFAAQDSLVYALDMVSDSATYLSTLRYHVVPNRRHTYLELQNLSSPFLDTMLPHYSILIGKTTVKLNDDVDNSTADVLVDGVRISAPDLYLGSTIAVHGIDGILVTGLNTYQELFGTSHSPLPPLYPRIISSEAAPPTGSHDGGETTHQNLPPGMPMFPYSVADYDWTLSNNNNKGEGPDPAPTPAAGAVSITDDNDWNNNINLPPANLGKKKRIHQRSHPGSSS